MWRVVAAGCDGVTRSDVVVNLVVADMVTVVGTNVVGTDVTAHSSEHNIGHMERAATCKSGLVQYSIGMSVPHRGSASGSQLVLVVRGVSVALVVVGGGGGGEVGGTIATGLMLVWYARTNELPAPGSFAGAVNAKTLYSSPCASASCGMETGSVPWLAAIAYSNSTILLLLPVFVSLRSLTTTVTSCGANWVSYINLNDNVPGAPAYTTSGKS